MLSECNSWRSCGNQKLYKSLYLHLKATSKVVNISFGILKIKLPTSSKIETWASQRKASIQNPMYYLMLACTTYIFKKIIVKLLGMSQVRLQYNHRGNQNISHQAKNDMRVFSPEINFVISQIRVLSTEWKWK